MSKFGVHSEVGKLRTVMVCRPGLAHQRLTPGNCKDLLFDDVLWVQEAKKDHYDFVLKMQERGVEVARPARTARRDAREQGSAQVHPGSTRDGTTASGRRPSTSIRPWLDEMPAKKLADHLIGGIAISDLPQGEVTGMLVDAFGGIDFVLPPIPNTLFQRDPSCWIYGGVTVNPMFWPARKPETLLQRAVYKFHPRFAGTRHLVGRLRRGLHRRIARRRRRDADRQRRRAQSAWVSGPRGRPCRSSPPRCSRTRPRPA